MKRLKRTLPKKSGRSKGSVVVRHQGGRRKRMLREIDWKRDKKEIWGVVDSIEFDPNRGADIALITYEDGEKRYILAPSGLGLGDKIIASESAGFNIGNTLSLGSIPVGTSVHNIEIVPGKGGQMVKSAGVSAVIQGKEEGLVMVKLPSGEIRKFDQRAVATIGQIAASFLGQPKRGKAGRKRRLGVRPTVRGTAQHPKSHPHGGGEGRSGIGLKYPKTPYGKPAVGKTRKKKKYSDHLIIKGRKKGKHVG